MEKRDFLRPNDVADLDPYGVRVSQPQREAEELLSDESRADEIIKKYFSSIPKENYSDPKESLKFYPWNRMLKLYIVVSGRVKTVKEYEDALKGKLAIIIDPNQMQENEDLLKFYKGERMITEKDGKLKGTDSGKKFIDEHMPAHIRFAVDYFMLKEDPQPPKF